MNVSDRPTHLDAEGRGRMVDVGAKPSTTREAKAIGRVRMARETFEAAQSGDVKKGDVRAVSEIAGVMAGKRASELIPLCHPLALSSLQVTVQADASLPGYEITATARTTGQTGVEMEALTAVAVAGLTLYDMLKALDRNMLIDGVQLLAKSGGVSGDVRREPG